MSAPIGFVILSHAQPELLRRLLSTLDRVYRNPPVVVHHDFSQCSLPTDANEWSTDLQYVRPNLQTEWARFSIPMAFLAALSLLYKTRAPEWFVLLSAADYPTRAGSSVVRELTTGDVDLYMDYQFVDRAPLVPEPEPAWQKYLGVGKEPWRQIANERYINPDMVSPFSDRLRCCGGDFWLTGNARVARRLIDAPSRYPELFKYYSTAFCPDESLCHTILGNDPDLRILKDNKRFSVWPDEGAHPRTLELADLPTILASGCHFARKISLTASEPLLNALKPIAVWE
jgi:hypothetical protein